MKKLLAAGLVLTMGLSLTACMGGASSSGSAGASGSGSGADASASAGTRRGLQCRHLPADAAPLPGRGHPGVPGRPHRAAGRPVEFDYQNAGNEPTNCTSIITKFVTDNVDLIMANATLPAETAKEATTTIPIVAPPSPTTSPPASWTPMRPPAPISPATPICPM